MPSDDVAMSCGGRYFCLAITSWAHRSLARCASLCWSTFVVAVALVIVLLAVGAVLPPQVPLHGKSLPARTGAELLIPGQQQES